MIRRYPHVRVVPLPRCCNFFFSEIIERTNSNTSRYKALPVCRGNSRSTGRISCTVTTARPPPPHHPISDTPPVFVTSLYVFTRFFPPPRWNSFALLGPWQLALSRSPGNTHPSHPLSEPQQPVKVWFFQVPPPSSSFDFITYLFFHSSPFYNGVLLFSCRIAAHGFSPLSIYECWSSACGSSALSVLLTQFSKPPPVGFSFSVCVFFFFFSPFLPPCPDF